MIERARIALFVPTLEGGGAERVMMILANRFAGRGHTVELVLQSARGPYLKSVDARVTIIDLNARGLSFCLLPLASYFRRRRPDVTLSTTSSANIVAILAWLLAGKRGKLMVREATTPSADDHFKPSSRARLVRRLRRILYPYATEVIAPSNGVANDLIRYDGIRPEHVRVIPNPIDFAEIRQLAAAELPLGAGIGDPLVLAVGSLTELKGFDTLIRAFAKVVASRRAFLAILGEGGQRLELQRLIASLGVSDRVVLPGFVENPFSYMRHAAVLVLSSHYEGLPNSLLQGLAVGTALVSTDCAGGGPREILENGRWGRLVPIGDVDAMSNAISDALEGRIALPSAADVEARYDADLVSEHYLSRMLNDHRRSTTPAASAMPEKEKP